MQATERLYLTADRTRVVREGDPEAAFLYAAPGDEIPDSAAEKFGVADGWLSPPAPPEPAPSPTGNGAAGGEKEAGPGSDKDAGGGEDKDAGAGEDKGGGAKPARAAKPAKPAKIAPGA